jgi:hypothetical protein
MKVRERTPTTTQVLGVTTGSSSSTLTSTVFSVSLTQSSFSSEDGSLWPHSGESCILSSSSQQREDKLEELRGLVLCRPGGREGYKYVYIGRRSTSGGTSVVPQPQSWRRCRSSPSILAKFNSQHNQHAVGGGKVKGLEADSAAMSCSWPTALLPHGSCTLGVDWSCTWQWMLGLRGSTEGLH